MKRKINVLHALDWWAVGLFLVCMVFGWLNIYAACYDFEHSSLFDFGMRYGKQLIWMAFSIVLAATLMLVDAKFYKNISYWFYAFMILLLVATIFLSPNIKGSHSWLKIGSFTFQPAEFSKYATALCLARFMSSFHFNIHKSKSYLLLGLIIGLPFILIILQNETGSALVFAAFLLVLFREGMNGLILAVVFIVATFFVLVLRYNVPVELADGTLSPELFGFVIVFVLAVLITTYFLKYYRNDKLAIRIMLGGNISIYALGILLHYLNPALFLYTYTAYFSILLSILFLLTWSLIKRQMAYLYMSLFLLATVALGLSADYAFNNVLQDHQRGRIQVVLGIKDDPLGVGYNVRQSQIAIGSGGISGKGFLNGTQTKLNYVPEQDTDFIFCTIGEEWGFLGSVGVLIAFGFFFVRLIYLAERQRSSFSRIYGYSVVSILFFHFSVNIGMVIGLLPVIGIPLPFFSYGGSSLWGFTLLLFTFLRLDANRKEELS